MASALPVIRTASSVDRHFVGSCQARNCALSHSGARLLREARGKEPNSCFWGRTRLLPSLWVSLRRVLCEAQSEGVSKGLLTTTKYRAAPMCC